MIPDDRLRLIFTCCHPALAREAQVALTLRLVCGLTTAEIARAFLVSEPTMAARVTRAKKKISAARIAVPGAGRSRAARPARRRAHRHPPALHDRAHRAVGRGPGPGRPGRAGARPGPHAARARCPTSARSRGLLALLLLTDARRATRTDADGRLLLLEEQDRRRWDRAAIAEGARAGRGGAARRPAGPVRAAGGDRRAARRGAELRRDRLAAGARRSTTCCCGSGRRRWSRSTGRVAVAMVRRTGRRRWPRSRRWRPTAGWPATATCPRPRPTCCAGSAARTRPPPRTGPRWPGRQRRRARLPHRAASPPRRPDGLDVVDPLRARPRSICSVEGLIRLDRGHGSGRRHRRDLSTR